MLPSKNNNCALFVGKVGLVDALVMDHLGSMSEAGLVMQLAHSIMFSRAERRCIRDQGKTMYVYIYT